VRTLFNPVPETRVQGFDRAGREVLAHRGRSLFVNLALSSANTHSLKLFLIAGSSSLILDTNGKLSEGIVHTGGQYGSVTFPF